VKDALAIRQCQFNVEAILRHYGLHRPVIIATQSDRLIMDRSRIFLDELQALVPDRFEEWPFNRNHGLTAIRGWRERVARCSLQIVEHETAVLELDIDEWNPGFGIGPALFHLGEVWRHYIAKGKTSPWVILKGLQRRGLSVLDVRTGEMT
jgi:hypothetical protein